jgi:hypothetical protein
MKRELPEVIERSLAAYDRLKGGRIERLVDLS